MILLSNLFFNLIELQGVISHFLGAAKAMEAIFAVLSIHHVRYPNLLLYLLEYLQHDLPIYGGNLSWT